MKKKALRFALPVLALFAITSVVSLAQFPKKSPADTGTLETFIIGSGTAAMQLNIAQLNGAQKGTESETLRFQAVGGSFFPVVVFNDELRGAKLGSIGLIPLNSAALPEVLNASINQLVIEKVESSEAYEIVVRDKTSGFTFFNIEGISYDFDAASDSLNIDGGRLLVSEQFAQALGRPGDASAVVGTISVSAALRSIEVRKVVNGEDQSAVLPAATGVNGESPEAFVNGPDVIVGDLPSMQQFGSSGTRVGLAIGTTSCNAGNVQLNWFAMPNVDHPVIPQNLYRMSGGATNSDRFEQIGHSWLKHAFTALQQNGCSFGCSSSGTGTRLGVGCSDPYDASLNASQGRLGSRAFVNPFTGSYPSSANNHNAAGHSHDGTSHRLLVEAANLLPASNVGATYFGEAQYVTPHEYAWCQTHPGECNMYNNTSYRRFNVTGSGTNFSFSPVGATVRTDSAIKAWTGATINPIEPAPGTDGRGFIAYKVSGPVNGVYHYEYAIYNQNLDRDIQAFSVPLACGVTLTNVGFHAPPNHPGTPDDGTVGGTGYSNTPWTPTQSASSMTWATQTFAQNPNANAIRWGTMYNFRFDSTRPPQAAMATVGFFKTGQPITVAIEAPSPGCSALQAVSAVSRKTHGTAGTFDIGLPFGDQPGIESRRSADGNHTIVFTFTNEVVSGNAAVTEGTGNVARAPTFNGNTMTVVLSGVPNAQRVGITLSGVTDSFSQTMPDTSLTMKALFGDTDGNSSVSASDVGRVKSQASSPITAENFRSDVTADGAITSSDIGAVKSMAGTTLP
jgi:hypothetical protein